MIRAAVIFVICLLCSGYAKTRWSSLQMVPSADMLKSGSFVLGFESFFPFEDVSSPVMGGSVAIGFHDRVNLELGYVDGFTMGFKALLLSEPNAVLPSVVLGVHNIFTNREGSYYANNADSLNNEFYFVFGKNFDAWRTRLHLGVQLSTNLEDNRINPLLGIEKYLGAGIYVNMEGIRRDEHYCLSLFTAMRFLKGALELNLGAVDFIQMFAGDEIETFVKPGLRASLKFRGITRVGSLKGIEGIEDRMDSKEKMITGLRSEIDTLKDFIQKQSSSLDSLGRAVVSISGTIDTDENRMRVLVTEKLTALKVLYEQEPFEPDQVNRAVRELVSYREQIVPLLMEKAMDIRADHKMRTISVSLLGQIGNRMASDVLLEILGRSKDPEIRIEALIALGKMNETRAGYLMQVLTADPNDAVAFTATEVLRELETQTGMDFTTSAIRHLREAEPIEDEVVIEDHVVGFSVSEEPDPAEEELGPQPDELEQEGQGTQGQEAEASDDDQGVVGETSDDDQGVVGEEEHTW